MEIEKKAQVKAEMLKTEPYRPSVEPVCVCVCVRLIQKKKKRKKKKMEQERNMQVSLLRPRFPWRDPPTVL